MKSNFMLGQPSVCLQFSINNSGQEFKTEAAVM